jgi:hypothetical protein
MKDDQEELLSYKDWDILIRRAGNNFQIGISRGYTTVIWLEKAVYNNLEEAMTGGLTYGKLIVDKIKHGKFSEGIFK